MSRPRGPKRVDRPEDRAELIALTYAAWRRYCDLQLRVPFSAPHYGPLDRLPAIFVQILEALGEQPIRAAHSVACNPPGFRAGADQERDR